MPIQALPLEIVTAVVECVPSKKDLSSISLVSTYFLPLARPFLFSSICLPKLELYKSRSLQRYFQQRSSDLSDYRDFIALLTSAPHLAFFIRTLIIWGCATELGPALLSDMLSILPSLRTLWLRGVTFPRINTSVPYRYPNIDRLILFDSPWATMETLALFSHIHELEIDVDSSWMYSGLYHQIYQWWTTPKTLPEVSTIRLQCVSEAMNAWSNLFMQTHIPKTLQSFSIHCDLFTTHGHPSSKLFDLLREAASTLTHLSIGTSFTPGRL